MMEVKDYLAFTQNNIITKYNIMKKIFTTIFLSVFAFVAMNAQAPAQTAPVTGPSIQFENMVHDYGTINRGADGNCTFEFTNTGTEDLVLSNVQSSCGCTVPSYNREPVKPGEKGTINVRYDTNRVGGISKAITVYSNDSNGNERLVLRISGQVLAQ
ncbi:hypothetical protein FACS1894153_3250 [Bacteroidia bacterium]|nr:hypothetical protein FACS1894153_3250 [Bacteroidia bacterium]